MHLYESVINLKHGPGLELLSDEPQNQFFPATLCARAMFGFLLHSNGVTQ
jgi:hypothetical protein